MNYSEYYKNELANPNIDFFIFDSKGDAAIGDIDFVKYSWETNMYNQVKEGDMVIFRRPGKASETGKFYFYGAAKIGHITGHIQVAAHLIKAYPFAEHIHMEDLDHFKWSFREKGKNWLYFFNQYGMNKIHRVDFENLMELADSDAYDLEPEAGVEAFQDIQKGSYAVDDKEGKTKIRTKQRVFSNKVKDQYKGICAVCGLKTKAFLIGSHIVPWSVNKEIRLDPSNGISLCIFHDKAFDLGYFTLTNDLKIVISKTAIEDEIILGLLLEIQGKKIKTPTINAPNIDYLKYHREKVFEKYLV